MADDVIRVYEFIVAGREVYIQAQNPDHANYLFRERFGYWPGQHNVGRKLDGNSET
jgi:hypothetical protein